MLTAKLKEAWLKELRDPTNNKSIGKYFESCELRPISYEDIIDSKCMCATGALVKVAITEFKVEFTNCADLLTKYLDKGTINKVVKYSDDSYATLAEIADWVEKNIPCTP